MTLLERIAAGEFDNTAPYVRSRKEDPEGRATYEAGEQAAQEKFKAALLDEFGYSKHPAKDVIYAKAWADGHAYGFSSVYNAMIEIDEFISDFEKAVSDHLASRAANSTVTL